MDPPVGLVPVMTVDTSEARAVEDTWTIPGGSSLKAGIKYAGHVSSVRFIRQKMTSAPIAPPTRLTDAFLQADATKQVPVSWPLSYQSSHTSKK